MQNNTDIDKTQTPLAISTAGMFYRVAGNFYGDLHVYSPSERLGCHFVEGTGPWAGTYAAHLSFGRADTFDWIGDSLADGSRCALGVLEPVRTVGAASNMAEFVVLCTNARVLEVHIDTVGGVPADQAARRVLYLLLGGRLDLCRLGASCQDAAFWAGMMISRIVHPEAWFEFGRRLGADEADPPGPPVVDVAALPAWDSRKIGKAFSAV